MHNEAPKFGEGCAEPEPAKATPRWLCRLSEGGGRASVPEASTLRRKAQRNGTVRHFVRWLVGRLATHIQRRRRPCFVARSYSQHLRRY
jgi:hypothetical protein